MDVTTRVAGLNQFLTTIYQREADVGTVLHELGFEQAQIEQMQNGLLEVVMDQFLGVIHRRLTSDFGKDTYYHILCRCYGLDGEPPEQLSAIAESYGYSSSYLHQLFEEIIHRCQSKTWQPELRRKLRYVVVEKLGHIHERPTLEEVTEKLERLSQIRNAAEFTRLDYETKRAQILQQVQAELDALDSEYRPVMEAVQEHIASLENEIKTDVLLYGESVSGGMYHASYTEGSVSWDDEGMSRYAASHPEVLQFRKQEQPTVSLQRVNKG
jgi:predicted house-cleaning noncanonical NTP pyrophosphatase (MazG superfamily)